MEIFFNVVFFFFFLFELCFFPSLFFVFFCLQLQVERTAGTFRSPWVARRIVLTEVGVYVFELSRKKERGALLLMIPIETVNGVLIETEKKKKFYLVLASFFKDHRFLCDSEASANEWRRLLAAAMVGRRKQATVVRERKRKKETFELSFFFKKKHKLLS